MGYVIENLVLNVIVFFVKGGDDYVNFFFFFFKDVSIKYIEKIVVELGFFFLYFVCVN